jgi:hypothetical protein
MTPESETPRQWRQRLEALVQHGRTLEEEGLPFPTQQIQTAYDGAVARGDLAQASSIVKRGEALLARVRADWSWVKELLRRSDELRASAETIGVDVAHLDHRVGNPRGRLSSEPLSSGSLDKAAASASLSLAVLNDAIPKFIAQEAQQLGISIRRARDRGEDIREASTSFSRLLQAVQDQNLPTAAQRLLEARRAVGRIPRAPALPAISPHEEEEILLEARNLARRLHRIRGKAQNAQSAARLMAQVRAAISEERRYGTPEEEIEALWTEVDRLTRERKRASEGPPLSVPALPEVSEAGEGPAETPPETSEMVEGQPEAPPETSEAGDPGETPTEETVADENGGTEAPAEEAPNGEKPPVEDEEKPPFRPAYYVPYIPPEPSEGEESDPNAPATPGRGRSRYRHPA